MYTIVLTGGGTAGHVTPNLALLPNLLAEKFEVHYIGSKNSIESKLAGEAGLPFYHVSTGKLRRSLNIKSTILNIRDQFLFAKGISEARRTLKKIKPNVVFSKGGFVSVPVVLAAKSLGVPVVIHESDITPGLANKISFPFADAICVSFSETLKNVPTGKGVFTGTPVRKEITDGNKEAGKAFCKFDDDKPVLLIIGGSSGSKIINDTVFSITDKILKKYNVVHLVGPNNLPENFVEKKGLAVFEYLKEELPSVLALADVVVSRAGANALQEFLALKKPSLLIPLGRATRGDQIQNAK